MDMSRWLMVKKAFKALQLYKECIALYELNAVGHRVLKKYDNIIMAKNLYIKSPSHFKSQPHYLLCDVEQVI